MDFTFSTFSTFLTILWFFVYWILGGVFFAAIALLRLGRVRKVRFSCLFTIWVYAVAMGVAVKGLEYSSDAIEKCTKLAESKAEMISALFGCGFSGVFGAFLIGAFAVTAGGFLIFAISRTKSKPWIVLEQEESEEGNMQAEEKEESSKPDQKTKYF